MTEIGVDARTATLERSKSQDIEDELQHGAHIACQADAPFVTLACGKVAGWEEQDSSSTRTRCPMCWNVERCPACGMRLRKET